MDAGLRKPTELGQVEGHREPFAARRASGCTPRRQASEQYSTRSQSRSHFLRQTNGRAQATHTLEGRFAFFMFASGSGRSIGVTVVHPAGATCTGSVFAATRDPWVFPGCAGAGGRATEGGLRFDASEE